MALDPLREGAVELSVPENCFFIVIFYFGDKKTLFWSPKLLECLDLF
jgi:hypothetical protein